MHATINTFPPFQSMNSPRGLILGLIVLLHMGFFFAFSAGLMPDLFPKAHTDSTVVIIPPVDEPERRVEPHDYQPTNPVDLRKIWIPEPNPVTLPEDPPITPVGDPEILPPPPQRVVESGGSAEPVWTQPEIDPRRALSEPMYPPVAIRAGWTGTVILSVQVLENGQVGEIRIAQSSGYVQLDESAKREARKWRLKPGTRDGIPFAMWKQIPISFRLKDAGSGF